MSQSTQPLRSFDGPVSDDTAFLDVQEGGFTPVSNTTLAVSWAKLVAGSACAVALSALLISGYGMYIREIRGLPIVGPSFVEMRIRPEDPGGQIARNMGLEVNSIAGEIGIPVVGDITFAPAHMDIEDY